MTHSPILINGVRDRNPVLILRHISNLRVIAMGDSSVFGVGDQGDAIPSVGAGWAGRVAHDLGVAHFLNVAKNGARARHIVKHQLSAAVAFKPHLVLMCIGTNDVLRGDFSREEIKNSLNDVIEQMRSSKSVIVLLGLPDPIKTAPGPLSLRKILNTYELHPYDIGKYDEFLSMPDDVLDRMTPKDTVNRKEDITSLQHIIKKIMLEDFEIALNNASDNEVEKFVEGLQDNA